MSDRPVRHRRDLDLTWLDELSWAEGSRADSASRVSTYISAEAEKAAQWYLNRKGPVRRRARIYRFLAIVFTVVAGLIPLLVGLTETPNGGMLFSPSWASVALLIAGALVGLDHFFGYSSSWMRYMTTELELRSALKRFRLEWQIQMAKLGGEEPTDDQLQEMLNMCLAFMDKVNAELENELEAWKAAFQAALKQIEDRTRAKAQTTTPGGANITVTNGDECADGWQLTVDDGIGKTRRGTTAAVMGLKPGIHIVKVSGRIGDRAVEAEKAVEVMAGTTEHVTLELS